MKTKMIKVKRKHMLRGIARDPACCPIALAVAEEFVINAVKDIYVDVSQIYVDGILNFRPPKQVSNFIRKFDNDAIDRKTHPMFKFKLKY